MLLLADLKPFKVSAAVLRKASVESHQNIGSCEMQSLLVEAMFQAFLDSKSLIL